MERGIDYVDIFWVIQVGYWCGLTATLSKFVKDMWIQQANTQMSTGKLWHFYINESKGLMPPLLLSLRKREAFVSVTVTKNHQADKDSRSVVMTHVKLDVSWAFQHFATQSTAVPFLVLLLSLGHTARVPKWLSRKHQRNLSGPTRGSWLLQRATSGIRPCTNLFGRHWRGRAVHWPEKVHFGTESLS